MHLQQNCLPFSSLTLLYFALVTCHPTPQIRHSPSRFPTKPGRDREAYRSYMSGIFK